MTFKDRLKEARINLKMTQEQLGTLIGVAKSTITGYEKGNSEPDMVKLCKIMESLHIDANYLFQDAVEDQKKAPPSEDESVSEEAMQIAKAYDDAILKDKNTVRVALGFPLIKEEASNTGKMA